MVLASTPTFITAPISYPEPPPDGDRAFFTYIPDPVTGETKNFKTVPHDMVVENVRGREDSFTLDGAGFLFHKTGPSVETLFTDDEAIQRDYYPESIELYKKLTGASRVVIFDHTVRRNDPANLAHVDQSFKAGPARVRRHIPDEAEELLKKRFQIVNLWTPIGRPAWAWPLGLCEYGDLNPEKDVFPVALIRPDHDGETYGVHYSPDHKWKYLGGMTPEEIILIKCYDSLQDGSVAVYTPHTAFPDPTTPANAPPREFIELRALVFYD